ncbi:hypothetical protein KIPB_006916, partial [Kipferlia bialata]|eukprot:g6916.t1
MGMLGEYSFYYLVQTALVVVLLGLLVLLCLSPNKLVRSVYYKVTGSAKSGIKYCLPGTAAFLSLNIVMLLFKWVTVTEEAEETKAGQ